MRYDGIKTVLMMGAAYCLAVASVSGFSTFGPLTPDHDWTCAGPGGWYGIQGYGGYSYVEFASHSLSMPLPFYAAIGLLIVLLATVWCLGLHVFLRGESET